MEKLAEIVAPLLPQGHPAVKVVKVRRNVFDLMLEGYSTPIFKMYSKTGDFPLEVTFDGEDVLKLTTEQEFSSAAEKFFSLPHVVVLMRRICDQIKAQGS